MPINPDHKKQWKYNLLIIGIFVGIIGLSLIFGGEFVGANLPLIFIFIIGVLAGKELFLKRREKSQ